VGREVEYVRRYEFPAELGRKLAEARPDLSPDDVERVLEALRVFLGACALTPPTAGAPLAIPSTVADEAWADAGARRVAERVAGVLGLFGWIGLSLWASELAGEGWGWVAVAAMIFIPLGAA
jgi:hypothetical protein